MFITSFEKKKRKSSNQLGHWKHHHGIIQKRLFTCLMENLVKGTRQPKKERKNRRRIAKLSKYDKCRIQGTTYKYQRQIDEDKKAPESCKCCIT